MSISEVISLLSGVALFLFGMTLMGDGLKRVAGSKLELVLYRLSNTTLKGVLLGTGVTAVIQSSCATSVMVVGFVNSGMMKVRQAISVILGAILGTSVTGWVISLSYLEGSSGVLSLLSTATLTGVVAVVGIILRMFTKKQLNDDAKFRWTKAAREKIEAIINPNGTTNAPSNGGTTGGGTTGNGGSNTGGNTGGNNGGGGGGGGDDDAPNEN